jgi:phenylalanyl-tRNA synthetase beta chain
MVTIGEISHSRLKSFDIKQPVFFIDFNWLLLLQLSSAQKITYHEVSKFPAIHRDLALVVDKNIDFNALLQAVDKLRISKLKQVQLFDIFESEKLGKNKKSMAVSFTFMDEEKTLTDKEIDGIINKLIRTFETELSAEIRK